MADHVCDRWLYYHVSSLHKGERKQLSLNDTVGHALARRCWPSDIQYAKGSHSGTQSLQSLFSVDIKIKKCLAKT